jgi:hypothetical protein
LFHGSSTDAPADLDVEGQVNHATAGRSEDVGCHVSVFNQEVDLRLRILGLKDEFCVGVREPKRGLRGATPDQLVAEAAVVDDGRLKIVHRKANAVDLAKQWGVLAHLTSLMATIIVIREFHMKL